MPEQKPSRALGISALVIALVPVLAWGVVAIYPAVFPAPGDSFGWLFLVAAVLTVATPGILPAKRPDARLRWKAWRQSN